MRDFPSELRGMSNHFRRRRFTEADDDMIRSQPENGISIRRLERALRTSREALHRRADELGVILREHEGANVHDEPLDTRTLGPDLRDPLLAALQRHHGDR